MFGFKSIKSDPITKEHLAAQKAMTQSDVANSFGAQNREDSNPLYGISIGKTFSVSGDKQAAYNHLREVFKNKGVNTTTIHIAGKYIIDFLPEGVGIRRIWNRKGINKWSVKYHSRKAEYYAPTLDDALDDFFRCNPQEKIRYNALAMANRTTDSSEGGNNE